MEGIGTVLKMLRLMQFGHVERKEDADWVKRRTSVIVGGFTPNAQDVAELQAGKMQMLGVVARDATDRAKWRRATGRKQANPEQTGQMALKTS